MTYRRRPDRSPPLPHPEGALPQVDLIRLYAGSDDRFLRSSLESGSRAIVLEATGRGNANERVLPGVEAAVAAGVPVVVCSRCLAGRVEPVYGRGGGKDLAEAGAALRRRPRGPEGARPPPARARRRPGRLAGPCCRGRMSVRVEVRQKEVSPCPY